MRSLKVTYQPRPSKPTPADVVIREYAAEIIRNREIMRRALGALESDCDLYRDPARSKTARALLRAGLTRETA